MRIEKFRVQGFKNFTQEIVLDKLRGYNVIHGVNNVGKSNLLEAMALLMCGEKYLNTDIWCLTDASVTLEIEAVIPDLAATLTTIGIPAKNHQHQTMSVQVWASKRNETDIRWTLEIGESRTEILDKGQLQKVLAPKRRGPMERMRFMILPVSRLSNDAASGLNLALEMYDAQQSEDIFNVKRWRTFVDAMKAFQDLTGPGEFVATYNRQSSQAQLMFESKEARVPFRLLGSGIQQIVTLLGMILMSNASIIAIEEPELNLRWALQTRLADVLKSLLDTPDAGIDQLFITTHSPAFSDTPDFWLMQKGIAGPTISRRPSEDLALVLQDSLESEPKLPKRTMEAWLTKDGIVKVPPRVQKLLHLADGGAVAFREAPNGVLIQNEDEALAIAGLGPTLELAHED